MSGIIILLVSSALLLIVYKLGVSWFSRRIAETISEWSALRNDILAANGRSDINPGESMSMIKNGYKYTLKSDLEGKHSVVRKPLH